MEQGDIVEYKHNLEKKYFAIVKRRRTGNRDDYVLITIYVPADRYINHDRWIDLDVNDRQLELLEACNA